jgi:FixJ family two-component response regulator
MSPPQELTLAADEGILFDPYSSADEITKEVTTTLNEALISKPRLTHERSERLLSDEPGLLERLACVVIDLHFDNSTMNGVDVGQKLKRDRPNLPTLLS